MHTLHDVLHNLYAPLRSLSEKSVVNYGCTILAFRGFLGHEPTLDDLSDELNVAKFLRWRSQTRAIATAAKDRAQLRALHEFAARRKLCDHWPQYPPIIVPDRVPEAWFSSEMQRLLDAAGKEKTVLDGIPGGLWWRALLLLAYDSAERASALTSLRWRSVRGRTVLFVAEDRKGQRRDILREIGEDTLAALEAIRGDRGPDDLVFPWPRSKTYIWKRLAIILKRAGLPHGRRDKFHRIRRTTASYFEAAGGSAQRLLDHADPATTRKYIDPRIVRPQAAPELIPRVSCQTS
jgi:site-specific recombinase XerD